LKVLKKVKLYDYRFSKKRVNWRLANESKTAATTSAIGGTFGNPKFHIMTATSHIKNTFIVK
jgi:hypothetical protein